VIRDLELAFLKIHILYHATKEEVFGIGLTEELARHGYKVGPGTLYPTLSKLEKAGFLTCEARTVDHKQRKYYRITREGGSLLDMMKNKIIELYKEVIEGK
jgi:PadR family transcriptional regulator, regulatory protein PadR